MKPFLILQLRPEVEASDGEFAAFLGKGGLSEAQLHRVCLDREPLPEGLSLDDYAGVIVGGGPGCVSDDPATKDPVEARIEAEILSLMPEITGRDVPFMGCCYGIGILGHHLGAEVSKRRYGEPVGPVTCRVTDAGRRILWWWVCPRRSTRLSATRKRCRTCPTGVCICWRRIRVPTR